MGKSVMLSYNEKQRNRLYEVVPFGPSPDWYDTYWMTDRPAGLRRRVPYAATVSLLALLVAWFV